MNRSYSLAVIMMAAGDSRRFSDNKLMTPIEGIPMYQHTLNWVAALSPEAAVVVSQYEPVLASGRTLGMTTVINQESRLGVSHTIGLGLAACPSCDAYLFTVCDQPWLSLATVLALLDAWEASSKGMASLQCERRPGNPCVFSSRYVPELLALTGDTGGRAVIKKHPEDVLYYDIPDPRELLDIDTKEDLRRLR